MNINIFYDQAFFADKIFAPLKILEAGFGQSGSKRLDCRDLMSGGLSDADTVLVLPYNGYFPVDAFKCLKEFLAKGGDIITLGEVPFLFPCFWHKNSWKVYDPLNLGVWWTGLPVRYANQLGVSPWIVGEDSEVSRLDPFLEIRPAYRGYFGSAASLPCARFHSSLRPLDCGRRTVIAESGEESSPAPSITDYVNLVEPAGDPNVNGRILSVGFAPAVIWTSENYADFFQGLVKTLTAEKENRLPLGLRLSKQIIRKKSSLELELWSRPWEGNRKTKSLQLQLQLAENSDSNRVVNNFKVDPPVSSHSLKMALPTENLSSGAYRLSLQIEGEEMLSIRFTVLDTPEVAPPEVKATRVNGYPAFEIDGKKVPALIYAFDPLDRALDSLVESFSRTGVHIHHFLYPLMLGWKDDTSFDWSSFDEMAGRILRSDPSGLLYPRIFLETPPWWDKKYPEELVVYRDGNNFVDGAKDSKLSTPGFWSKTHTPSWASEKWRQDVKKVIEDFVRHAQNSVYGSRMFGYFFVHGKCGEWYPLNPDSGFSWEDLSAPSLKHFRQWLKRHYSDSRERELKFKSLNQFEMTEVRLPATKYMQDTSRLYHHLLEDKEKVTRLAHDLSPAEIEKALPNNTVRRHISKYGILRDPAQSWDTIEYLRYYRELFAEMITFFSRAVKEASGDRSLVGTFAGYLMSEFFCDADMGSHKFGFQQILKEAEKLDVITVPYHYYLRKNATGDANCKGILGSQNLTDKLFIDENDQATCLSDRHRNKYWGIPGSDFAVSIEDLKRNFILRLCQGAGLWWYDFGRGWYDHPRLVAVIAKLYRIHQSLLENKNTAGFSDKIDRLNVIYSTGMYDYLCACSNWARRNCSNYLQRHFNRSGFPWEVFFLEDLPLAPRRRAYLFLNTFSIDKDMRRFIDQELKKDGNILIWLYAAGLYEGENLSLKNCQELTGFELDWNFDWQEIAIKIQNFNHPVTAGLEKIVLPSFGTRITEDMPYDTVGDKISPQIFCIDLDAINLGVNEFTGKSAFAVKDFGSWKSVFVSGPLIPAVVMRRLLLWAGLNPTLDTDDALYTNGDLLGIHAKTGGVKTISLPDNFELKDLFENKKFLSQSKKISLEMKRGQTFIGRVKKR